MKKKLPRNTIYYEGRGQVDYEEFSNLAKKDLVPFFEMMDNFKQYCVDNDIPFVITVSPSDKTAPIFMKWIGIEEEKEKNSNYFLRVARILQSLAYGFLVYFNVNLMIEKPKDPE